MKVYVEGGGDKRTDKFCRSGFKSFLRKAGFAGHLPEIVACGGRNDAYKRFCKALDVGEHAFLLVDSEAPVLVNVSPLRFLLDGKIGLIHSSAISDERCHLMVQCMEAWLLADRDALQHFFGEGFRSNRLPARSNPVESCVRPQEFLTDATRECKREKRYRKGPLSFQILATLDHTKVIGSSFWAKRFVDTLAEAALGAKNS